MGAFDTVRFSALAKLLAVYGFTPMRQRGSHITYKKPGCIRLITIAKHGKEVPFYSAKQVMQVLQMSPSDFFDELKKY